VSPFVGLASGESALKLPYEGSGAVAARSLCFGLGSRSSIISDESKERGLRSRGVLGDCLKEMPRPVAQVVVASPDSVSFAFAVGCLRLHVYSQ
jgi:hypothetical protein